VPPRRYDLVVCQSVLQYLGRAEADRAIGVLGDATRGLLYLEVPTARDRDTVMDHEGSDMDVHWRSARWYRARLDVAFVEIGGGFWVSRDTGLHFFELERAPRAAT
jgi:hypothetical protein